jgi:hypothetical protein
MVRGLVLLLLVLLTSFVGPWAITADEPPAPKKLPPQETAFRGLTENASALLKTDFGKTQPTASDLEFISSSAKHIAPYLSGSVPTIRFSDEYLYGIAVDSWQLWQIASAIQDKSEPNFKEWAQQISDVRDDVYEKFNAASRQFVEGFPITGTPPETWSTPRAIHVYIDRAVTVTATTLDKDGKEVPTYEVWFCLKALINYKDRYDHFDRLSSPTDRKMVPGNYFFWTRKGSDEGAKIVINGIGNNDDDRKIDLPTP